MLQKMRREEWSTASAIVRAVGPFRLLRAMLRDVSV